MLSDDELHALREIERRLREALAPVREHLTEEAFRTLALSLAAASGLEAYLALKDVCRVDDQLADRILASNIEAILDHGLPVR